ncbi:two-component system response regulator [Acidovorax sp. sic0104]|uniref:response regulator n=1 Tax=Acidovorax sp. sic0104 TaxID=2854784 RepID=UPI001C4893F2|nr:two-component system response regulator [Acidovorax sp. sic0104]MBV7540316.1 two-component system response regulator [Acidovorax sp. sic0104]
MNESTPSAARPSVLVVDDTPQNLQLISELLTHRYKVRVAPSGDRALQIAQATPPDLILLDVVMPQPDGYEVCRRLKADARTRDIPVIFLTSRHDMDNEALGFSLGAVDYIAKPVVPPLLLARVHTHLTLKGASDFLRDKSSYLEEEVERRTQEVRDVRDVTVLALASLAEARDNDTGNHLLRTQRYVRLLATELRRHPVYAPHLDEQTIEWLYKSAPLHDVGKVGISDAILLKPGRLTPEEFEIMKTHTTMGRDAIAMAEHRLGKTVPFLRIAKEIAYSHQEKWDGSGYPQGLSGDAIPLSARLMAVADVYDALITRRVYKDAMTHEEAVGIVAAGRGSHFDPALVDAFLAREAEFQAIARAFADEPEGGPSQLDPG